MIQRCGWCMGDPLYTKYHDEEWGVPVHDEKKHFEFLVLESAQAGLSWLTILRKRENYRKAYDGFDPEKVAAYGEEEIERLLNDPGIIRNKKKIEASIANAKGFLAVQKEFGSFDNYIWGFVGGQPVVNHYAALTEIPASSELSHRISRDMKKRGFGFLGPVILYSHLQATGLIDDHIDSCFKKGPG